MLISFRKRSLTASTSKCLRVFDFSEICRSVFQLRSIACGKIWQCSAGNAPFVLCGDFNARTGNKQPYRVLDMEYFTTVAQDEQYGVHG